MRRPCRSISGHWRFASRRWGQFIPTWQQSLNDLGLLYHNQGRYEAALSLDQRALAIREQTQGPTHPLVALALNNLAVNYQALGRYAEAEALRHVH